MRIRCVELAGDYDWDKICSRIETIYEEANKKPERFEELAKNHSQIANRDNGGDMGFLPAASFAPLKKAQNRL
jgi:parvulin-like peptidyl-prolyl isomerase